MHVNHREGESSGRVVSSVILTGWGGSDIDTSKTSKAVSRAVAEAIGEHVVAFNVDVLKVEPAKTESDPVTPLKFNFEVVPASQVDASKTAQLFDSTLLSEINAAEPYVLLQSSFGAVWQ